MPLVVLSSSHVPSPETLLRLFHQTEQHWLAHGRTEEVLDEGTALLSETVGGTSGLIVAAISPADLAKVQQLFETRGATLDFIAFTSAADAFDGWRSETQAIYHLVRRRPVTGSSAVKLIPARASFRHVEQIAPELLVHLDDPHVDAWLAMGADGAAVGAVALLTVGETGQIAHLRAADGLIQARLLERAMEIAARSLLRHVFVTPSVGNQALISAAGFETIGSLTMCYRIA